MNKQKVRDINKNAHFYKKIYIVRFDIQENFVNFTSYNAYF